MSHLSDAQTEARAIAERLRAHRQAFGVHYEQRPVEVCIEGAEAIDRLATALVAKDAELAAAHKLACANAQDAADESERAARAVAQLAEARKALEPFVMTPPWADSLGWTDEAPVKDRICDWFGPSDFLQASEALRADKAHGGEDD